MARTLPDKIASAIYDDYIESKLLKPGDRLPTVRDLQRQYGRSNSIIVHALGLLETRKVLVKGDDGSCYVSSQADEPEPRPIRMIGHVLPAMTTPSFVMRVHTGIERACREYGYHLLTASANLDYSTEELQVARLVEAGCEAIIITPVIRTRKQLKHDYLRKESADLPIVLIDIAYPEQKHTQIILDNYQAGYDMTKLLLMEGHQRIAFMESNNPAGDLMHRSNRDRYAGYLRALKSAGLVPRPEDRWVLMGWSSQKEENINAELITHLLRWREQPDRPTAVIALEDMVAMQTILLGRELGVSVPEDLRVVGFDNLELANSLGASFPTTDPDMARAGEMAVGLAVRQMAGTATEPITYMLPVPILRRTSALEDHFGASDSQAVVKSSLLGARAEQFLQSGTDGIK